MEIRPDAPVSAPEIVDPDTQAAPEVQQPGSPETFTQVEH